MVERPETETLIENLLQACVDYERCERFDAKHRRLDLEEAKQAIRDAIGHAQCRQEPVAWRVPTASGSWYVYVGNHKPHNDAEPLYSAPAQRQPQPPIDNPLKAYSVEQLQYEIAWRLSDTSTNRGCGDPNCKDPNCTYGKGKPRCQNCGDPVTDALHAAGFCGTCREMGCSDSSPDRGDK